ncbi:hypothetical protein D3C76_1458840 [compost metagenome]
MAGGKVVLPCYAEGAGADRVRWALKRVPLLADYQNCGQGHKGAIPNQGAVGMAAYSYARRRGPYRVASGCLAPSACWRSAWASSSLPRK